MGRPSPGGNMKILNIGQRVLYPGEGIGHIEAIDIDHELTTVDVRWLTPNNEPSVVTSCVFHPEKLIPVSENVVPMQKSQEWWGEAWEFIAGIEQALEEC